MKTQLGFLTPKGAGAFGALKSASLHLTKASGEARKIGVMLDGVLAPPRTGRDIGAPLAGSLEWLLDVLTAGCEVYIYDDRPAATVWQWLKRHSPGLEARVHVCHQRPQVDVMLDASALRFDGKTYPTLQQLESLKPWWDVTDEYA